MHLCDTAGIVVSSGYNIAAFLCTISNLCLALAVWGFQAHVAYSSVGLTRAWYARVFTVSDGVRIFLFRSPSVRFAVEVIWLYAGSNLGQMLL